MTIAALFPGQGSQSVGMLADLAAAEPLVEQTFAEASASLGFDLWQLCQQGPAEQLNRTEYTQPAMLVAGIAAWRVWRAHDGPLPAIAAGHSLGEYSALVSAGALQLGDAAALVRERGRLMQSAVAEGVGAIAAVLGLDDAAVIALCAEQAQGQVLQAVNFNSPNQVVVAGHAEAVERMIEAAKTAGAKRALKLPVSVPVHSRLMDEAAAGFAEKVDAVALQMPAFPIVQNVEARAYESVEAIRAALRSHVNSPVRWSESVLNMRAQGATTFIEFGPGKVLAGLCKRIDRGCSAYCVENPDSLDKTLQAMSGD